ncbi:two-component sensor histidine kinase [Microbispora triticiradicis]|uniref:histidine kinase n=3 Tax=Microbispora triticiradicis TaxID=2200763 RepID=A0ABX9LL55_9ACTN|nr:two-component sensor histidine kinase [Microbispora triticiradicis]TLP66649.1 two-component sensor histidine kinase [Microbispora fusca]
MVRQMPSLHSMQTYYTTTATMLVLLLTVLGGVSLDLAIRYKVEDQVFFDAEQVAAQWSAQVRGGVLPNPDSVSGTVDLVQLVDARGRVVEASPGATERPRLSTFRPAPDNRLQRRVECHPGEPCLLLMANRVSPAPESPVVYAGTVERPLIATHRLEYLIAGAALLVILLGGRLMWWIIGRALRPAEQQRQLASVASHELRTPIAGLRVQLEEALLHPDHVDPRDTIRGALSATGRLEAIVQDLLTMARLRGGQPAPHEPIDLVALVTEEVDAHFGGTPVELYAAGDVWAHGSRIQLIRLVGNLLSNARRHAATGVTVCVGSADGQAVLSVTDDGNGIAPADRERVFERFTRLDEGRRRDAGGTGLGLAISRDIANAHRGSLRIEDSPRGARFVLRLPLLDRNATGERNLIQRA